MIEVSDVAIRQWRRLCKRHINSSTGTIIYKIRRAHALGQICHIYRDGEIVVQYHDLFILSSNGVALTVWRDVGKQVDVEERVKIAYDDVKRG